MSGQLARGWRASTANFQPVNKEKTISRETLIGDVVAVVLGSSVIAGNFLLSVYGGHTCGGGDDDDGNSDDIGHTTRVTPADRILVREARDGYLAL